MQREGSHGWSREPQMEGKGKMGSTKIMSHQHQAVDWEGCTGGSQPRSPSSWGDGDRKLPLIETAWVKHPCLSPDTIPRDGPQGKEWDRTSSAPTKHSDHLSHLCQQRLPQPNPFPPLGHPTTFIPPGPRKAPFSPSQPASSTPAAPSSTSPATLIATDAINMSPAPGDPRQGPAHGAWMAASVVT